MERQALTSASSAALYFESYSSSRGVNPGMHALAMPTYLFRFLLRGLTLMLAFGCSTVAAEDASAKEIYEATQNLVFQIRVIDAASATNTALAPDFW